MATKATTQETIVDLSDEQDTPSIAPESSTDVPTTEHVQHLKEGYTVFPEPTESAGKGAKWCSCCNGKMPARSMTCPHCNFVIYKDVPKAPKATGVRKPRTTHTPPVQATKVDVNAVFRVLRGKGYSLQVVQDILDPESKPTITCEKSIEPLLDLINSEEVQLIQSSPSIKYAVSLEGLMSIFKLKANK